MTKTEQRIIANIIERLKMLNCGASNSFFDEKSVKEMNANGVECVPRIYLDTWVLPALEALIEPAQSNRKYSLELAERMSKK